MRFDFVESADGTRLSKRYAIGDDGLVDTPYPMVMYLTSLRIEAGTTSELFAELKPRAEAGQALMKGNLSRGIRGESRAGLTNPAAPTHWVCLDLDFEDGWPDVDTFIAELNPAWANTSYIWQHSASAGIKHPIGLRGHLIILLEQSVTPVDLKLWLTMRNLELPGLAERIELAANGQSLKYPLDISTCQNDKALFIASPILRHIDDPIAERYVLKTKHKDRAPLPSVIPGQTDVQTSVDAKVAELRKHAGLPRQKARYKTNAGEQILVNPDGANVTDVKQERGFVYVNLNGGDSWGYYFPENKPQILYNFKGEPPVYLEGIAPDFYRSYVESLSAQRHGGVVKPYAFRDPKRDTYFNVLYRPDTDEIEFAYPASSRQKLVDFMGQYAEPIAEYIEDWTVEFNPTELRALDEQAQWMNTYRPSEYLRHADQLTPTDTIPPICDRVITSVTGGDQASKDYFMNWLACLFQKRSKLGTAWVFHGTTGTGKGILLTRILQPLLNHDHVPQWTSQHVEENFNAALESSVLLWLDEFHVDSSRQARSLMDKLKAYVTEDQMAIRAMRSNTYMVPSYLNLIIATNHPDPLALDTNDRRFNVAPPQERSLVITRAEIDAIQDELPMLASHLWNYDADFEKAGNPLENQARLNMIKAAQTSVDAFFNALREGNLDFFLEFLRSGSLNQYDLVRYNHFEAVLKKWCSAIQNPLDDGAIKVLRDDLGVVYEYCVGKPTTPSKLSRMCKIQRLEITRMRLPGDKKLVQGLYIRFRHYDEEIVDDVLNSTEDYEPFQVLHGYQ